MKKSLKAEFNTFIKGYITEASPLNFPENASFDEENFELNRNGTRQRRQGISFEPLHSLVNTPLTLENYKTAPPISFKWTEVNGNSELNFLVVQAGNRLDFFNMNSFSLSQNGPTSSLILTEYPSTSRYSITSVDGLLIVAAGVDTVAVVSYDSVAQTFSYELDRIKVRDLWGIEV
jgi:hypothetical protein